MGSISSNSVSRLVPDVRIGGIATEAADRIRIYDGTNSVTDQSYTLPAFVPRLPLRPATSLELQQLLMDAAEPFVASRHVGIIKGFKAVQNDFIPFLSRIEASSEYRPVGEEAASIDLINQKAVAGVEPFLDRNAPKPFLQKVGIVARKPGLLTTTFNYNAGKFIGLHLDNFFRRDLEDRPSSPNRICINVGSEPRFLIFINLTLRKCHELLNAAGFQEDCMNDPGRGLPELFMKRFPEYPVVQLRIDPGEAYIAPTENLIHDSTTVGLKSIDVSLIFLGTFHMPSGMAGPEEELAPIHSSQCGQSSHIASPEKQQTRSEECRQDMAPERALSKMRKEKYRCFYNEANLQLNTSSNPAQTYFLNYGYIATGGPLSPHSHLAEKCLEPDSARLALEVIGDCALAGKKILDVGCGRGGTISLLQRFFSPRSITGVDYSDAAIAFCREHHESANTAFQQADAERLPFVDGAFDAVINIESSHCYPDVQAFYREVYRVLAPDGYFLYTDLFQNERRLNYRRMITEAGFSIEKDTDISENVLLACRREAPYADPAFVGRGEMASLLGLIYMQTVAELKEGASAYRVLKVRRS
jgi:SAM-dependent methyltransferase